MAKRRMPSRSLWGRFFHSVLFNSIFFPIYSYFSIRLQRICIIFFLLFFPLRNQYFSTCSNRSIFSIIKSAKCLHKYARNALPPLPLLFHNIVDLPFISNFSFWVACICHLESATYFGGEN